MNLICIACGQTREKGRRRCRPCYLKQKIQHFKARYKAGGRYKYNLKCEACDSEFKGWRKSSKFCLDCFNLKLKLSAQTLNTNKYIKVGNADLHRDIVQTHLNRVLDYNEVVHHIDDNPTNNHLDNLLVMPRGLHNQFHIFIDNEHVIETVKGNNIQCWNSFIKQHLSRWLLKNNYVQDGLELRLLTKNN